MDSWDQDRNNADENSPTFIKKMRFHKISLTPLVRYRSMILNLVYHPSRLRRRESRPGISAWFLAGILALTLNNYLQAADSGSAPVNVADAAASTASEMKPYTDVISGADVKFQMVPIQGGKFTMGSPDNERGHKLDETPQHEVEIQ